VGDKVEGYYSLVEPDGTTRTVQYTADHHTGFSALSRSPDRLFTQPLPLGWHCLSRRWWLLPLSPMRMSR
jgi:hypothetical protein